MSRKNNVLPEDLQARLIEILNRRLVDAIDLQLQSRQAKEFGEPIGDISTLDG